MVIRILTLMCMISIFHLPACAEEKINRFDTAIDIAKNGDITVTETISVTAQGQQIRRGIYRDLPRTYLKEGVRLRYRYEIIDVRRNGDPESYTRESSGNAVRIRIGDKNVLLAHGSHIFQIRYRVKNQVRYFTGYDELYWNITGSYWNFPIEHASARITLPKSVPAFQQAAYTGTRKSQGKDYAYTLDKGAHIFQTTKPLKKQSGFTVALGFEKGIIDPPSEQDKRDLWWQRHGSLTVLLASLSGIIAFYWRGFNKVGRDPQKGPLVIHYEPPEGYSPAAVHHIFYRGLHGNKAIIASLLSLSISGLVTIKGESKKKTILEKNPDTRALINLPEEQRDLYQALFNKSEALTLAGSYNSTMTTANTMFQKDVARRFGADFFRWNPIYVVIAIPLSIGAIIFAAIQSTMWTQWHTLAVITLAVINGLFAYLMPAPTRRGQTVRTHIEGFRRYLETAEKLQLNQAQVGHTATRSGSSPTMTTERYERFLPYAIALDVEKPWTEYFEAQLPTEAVDYANRWHHGTHLSGHHSVHGINNALISGLNTGVATAMPQSSSSSGSGGGGFSGGGGGGGGGGGW